MNPPDDRSEPAGSPQGLAPTPSGPLLVTGWTAIRNGCLDLAKAARRELLIFSRDLDPALYDQGLFIAEVRRIALEVPHLPVRALVFDARAPVVASHRLIPLAQRLTSRIAIRRVGENFLDRLDAFLVADGRAYCLRRLSDRPEALIDRHTPAEAARLRAEFEQMWEQSDADPELQRLHL